GENVVYQDDELADAISEDGHVYLSMYYNETASGMGEFQLGSRIAQRLRNDFGLDAESLSKDLNVPLQQVEDTLAGVKRHVARELVAQVLKDRPTATFREVHQALLKTPFDRQTADRADILDAYQLDLSIRALRRKCPPVPSALAGKLPRLQE